MLSIALLGNVLITRVRDGLLDAKVTAAQDEAANGTRTMQEAIDSADQSDPGAYDTLVPDLVRQLSRGGGAAWLGGAAAASISDASFRGSATQPRENRAD